VPQQVEKVLALVLNLVYYVVLVQVFDVMRLELGLELLVFLMSVQKFLTLKT